MCKMFRDLGCCLILFIMVSCNLEKTSIDEEPNVLLSFNIDKDTYSNYDSNLYSSGGEIIKSNSILSDTNNFNLRVYSTEGVKVYDGKYGNRPRDFYVLPGGYDITLLSGKLNKPNFELPVYGDSVTIIVNNNEQINVKLYCSQLSGGVRLNFTDEFKDRYPQNGIYIQQDDNKLFYSYNEKRYAYIGSDLFSLIYSNNNKDTVLLSKTIAPSYMITMNLQYSTKNTNSSFSVKFDTLRNWLSNSYNIALKIPTGVYSIEEAKLLVGQKNIPVYGFIYGGDPTNTTVRIRPPFTSTSSFVIAPSMAERNRNNSFVVELPAGTIRDQTNLVAYPRNLGRLIVVVGEIVPSYFNYIGVKGTKSYYFLD